jgi:hypothetical protein
MATPGYPCIGGPLDRKWICRPDDSHFHVQSFDSSPLFQKEETTFCRKRLWAERLFSLPWRPRQATEIHTVIVPIPEPHNHLYSLEAFGYDGNYEYPIRIIRKFWVHESVPKTEILPSIRDSLVLSHYFLTGEMLP